MTELQSRLVDMMVWYHDFCEKNNLRYYIIAGTMLGAVRHGGFIPWDDDIDVGMPRSDYERLRKLVSTQEKGKYVFEYPSGSKSYPFLWAKLFDTTTTMIEKQRDKVKRGIYIDIFPIDGIGNTREEAIKNFQPIKKKLALNSMVSCAILKRRKWNKNFAIVLGRIISPIFVDRCKLKVNLDQLCQKHNFEDCEFVCNLMGGSNERGIVKKEYFGNPTKIKFEQITVYGLENPDMYLKSLYGNYKELPPVEKRVSLHDTECLNLNKGYMEKFFS